MEREIIRGGMKLASKFFKPLNKMMGAIGLIDNDDDDNYDELEDEDEDEEYEYDEPEIINPRKNKIVSIKTNISAKVILKKPTEMQDILEIVDAIKSKKIVVINIIDVEPKLAQRMIDYLVGGCYALNGSFQEIAHYVYLAAPETVEVTNELKQVLSKDSFYSFGEI